MSNAIDVDEPPTYTEGSVPGAPIDLMQGDETPICFICQHERHEGKFCNLTQTCCGGRSHRKCYRGWVQLQEQRYSSVSCPMCRRVLVDY